VFGTFFSGVLLVVSGSVLFFAVLTPALTGKLGLEIHARFIHFSGWSSLVIPVYMVWMGIHQFSADKDFKKLRDSFLFFVVFLTLSCFLSLISPVPGSELAKMTGAGGWLGDRVALFLTKQFGAFLVFMASLAILFVSGSLLLGMSPLLVLSILKEKIVQDIADWKAERKRTAEQKVLKPRVEKKPAIPLTAPAASAPTIASVPKIVTEKLMDAPAKTAKPEPSEKAPAPGSNGKSEPAESFAAKIFPVKSVQPASPQKTDLAAAAGTAPAPAAGPDYSGYRLPSMDLLTGASEPFKIDKDELYANGTLLEQTLEQFAVKAKVTDIHPGPVITRYDLSPAPGVRVQQIETLSDDIALAMKAQSLRVLAPVPGKAAVGIEISNPHPAMVYFKEIILSEKFQNTKALIPLVMGKTTEGEAYVADLCTTPHALIAGATGSGKSVCIHALLLSILFRFRPDEVKLLLIDPKRIELPVYDGIPHLYDPASIPEDVRVITQPKEAVFSLKKLVDVMELRYRDFAKLSVRNIESYNEKARAQGLPTVAYVVVIIDELADLMITVGKEIEDLIQRLAQMARAVGIHLVLATQRPSVDVITGVIKANLPTRAAFQVMSKTDSRVILDSQGAEDLLGRGDMLFLASGAPKPVRLQGGFVSEKDVHKVVDFIKSQNFKPHYSALINTGSSDSIVENEENQKLLIRACRVVRETEKVSGDLLRADKEIGSRYDLALTLLRKRGFIEKPKDSNRWKINLDLIAEFLAQLEQQQP
jgi:S-DNA-T family DNA segregation ATPase FtsK/SpoIIIE